MASTLIDGHPVAVALVLATQALNRARAAEQEHERRKEMATAIAEIYWAAEQDGILDEEFEELVKEECRGQQFVFEPTAKDCVLLAELKAQAGNICGAVFVNMDGQGKVFCTLDPGHTGRHSV